jgi:homoserine kinase
MADRKVTVRVPATTANLGPGFDCLGLALDLWATATVTVGDAGEQGPAEEMLQAAADSVYETLNEKKVPLSIDWQSDIPIGRGLGASAAVRAAGLLAANALLGEPLSREELLMLGSKLEGHADNMAPCLFGGLQVVVWDGEKATRVGLKAPTELQAVIFVPEFPMPTDESRRLLPTSLSRADAVHNIGRAALSVAALSEGRWDALDVATQDKLHQPARSQLFPAMYDIFAAAREAGALCAYLSGGGSSILALTIDSAERVGVAMQSTAEAADVRGRVIAVGLSPLGGEVIHR